MSDGISSRSRDGGTALGLGGRDSWQSFLTISMRMTTLLNRRLVGAHHLSLLDLGLLAFLDESDTGSAQMGDLIESLPGLPNRPTRAIRRLEDHGLVQRFTDAEDRRRVMLTITEKGRKALETAMATYADAVRDQLLDPSTQPYIASMVRTCEQLNVPLKR